MVARRPLVDDGGVLKETPVGDTLIGGLPAGGTSGQVLIKSSSADFDAAWSNSSGGVTLAQVKAIARKYATILG